VPRGPPEEPLGSRGEGESDRADTRDDDGPRATEPGQPKATTTPKGLPRTRKARARRPKARRKAQGSKRFLAAAGASTPSTADNLSSHLEIKSSPYCSVFVDGAEKGRNQTLYSLDLPPGLHKLLLRHPPHRDRKRAVVVLGDGASLPDWIVRWPALIKVRGAPGDHLQVDGKDVGSTDVLQEIEMRERERKGVRVKVVGDRPFEGRFTLRAGGLTVVDVE